MVQGVLLLDCANIVYLYNYHNIYRKNKISLYMDINDIISNHVYSNSDGNVCRFYVVMHCNRYKKKSH